MTCDLQGPAKWRGVCGAGGLQGPGEGPREAQADPGGKVGQEGSWEELEERERGILSEALETLGRTREVEVGTDRMRGWT